MRTRLGHLREPTLVLIRVLDEDRTASIEHVPFVIGREADCDLVLEDPRISRRHAQIEVLDDGRVILRDLGSANGTYVGEQRIEGGAWFDVPGTFRLGRTTLRIERDWRGHETVAIDGLEPGDRTIVSGEGPPRDPGGPSPAHGGVADRVASPAPARTPGAEFARAGPQSPAPDVGEHPRAPARSASGPRPKEVRSAQIALVAAGIVAIIVELLSLLVVRRLLDLGESEGLFVAVTLGAMALGAAQIFAAWLIRRPLRTAWQFALVAAGLGTALSGYITIVAVLNEQTVALAIPRLIANVFAVRYLLDARHWFRG